MNDDNAPASLSVWVVYERPTDYPEHYIARRWSVAGGKDVPTGDTIVCERLDCLRNALERRGLLKFPRFPVDDPVILETWL